MVIGGTFCYGVINIVFTLVYIALELLYYYTRCHHFMKALVTFIFRMPEREIQNGRALFQFLQCIDINELLTISNYNKNE